MKILIKIGGTLLDSAMSRGRLAAEIGAVANAGAPCVVVHGGGKQMTRFLAERGIESRFIDGLRVTTPEVLDAVLKVLAGSVNRELVAAFIAAGVLAVGLTGMDALTTEAEPLSAELGAVGKPVSANPALLRTLLEHGYTPVVACVAGDRGGHFYNVNADQMAVACAVALEVDQLFFLTDVEGVRGRDQAILGSLTPGECGTLIQEKVAIDGMRTKLEAAMDALTRSVDQVVIAPGAVAGVVQRLVSGQPIGTRLRA
ncbi:MAG: acetylglutamate kinase [Bryobacteraceae bacterium]